MAGAGSRTAIRTVGSTGCATPWPSGTGSIRLHCAAAGADGVILYLSLAALDPGDEVVCGWPSFPSYVLGAMKLGATPVRVPLSGGSLRPRCAARRRYARTKIVYVCNPNNPTGTMVERAALDEYFERVPEHVMTVLDEAYFEYIDDPDYPDGIEEHVKEGRRCVALRTFSKIYGLAGLVGYGVGSADVVTAIRKVQSAFDVTQPAQDAAPGESRRRGGGRPAPFCKRIGAEATRGRPSPPSACVSAGPAVGNFVFVDTARGRRAPLFEALLREGRDRPSAQRLRRAGSDPDHRRACDENAALLEAIAIVHPSRFDIAAGAILVRFTYTIAEVVA